MWLGSYIFPCRDDFYKDFSFYGLTIYKFYSEFNKLKNKFIDFTDEKKSCAHVLFYRNVSNNIHPVQGIYNNKLICAPIT